MSDFGGYEVLLSHQYRCKSCDWRGKVRYDRVCLECGSTQIIRVNRNTFLADCGSIDLGEVEDKIKDGSVTKEDMLVVARQLREDENWIEWRDEVLAHAQLSIGIHPNVVLCGPVVACARFVHEIADARDKAERAAAGEEVDLNWGDRPYEEYLRRKEER